MKQAYSNLKTNKSLSAWSIFYAKYAWNGQQIYSLLHKVSIASYFAQDNPWIVQIHTLSIAPIRKILFKMAVAIHWTRLLTAVLDWTTGLSFYHFYVHLTGLHSNLLITQILMADTVVLLLCKQMNVKCDCLSKNQPIHFPHKLKFILLSHHYLTMYAHYLH